MTRQFTAKEKHKTALQIINYLANHGSFYDIQLYTDNVCYSSKKVDQWKYAYEVKTTDKGKTMKVKNSEY